jgi:hypothetical protein
VADNKVMNAGSGGATVATDEIAGVDYQRVKPQVGADGSAVDVSSANPLPVVQTGTPGLPTGASTAAKQPALGTAGTASADVITVQGIASMTAVKVDGSAVTQPVSLATLPVTNAGTFAVQIAANSSVNQAQIAGTTTSVNSGAKDAGTQRVILASDQTVVPSRQLGQPHGRRPGRDPGVRAALGRRGGDHDPARRRSRAFPRSRRAARSPVA